MNIQISKYPALQDILWDIHAEEITAAEAYYYYETRWRYVDKTRLTEHELLLIRKLTDEVGNGVFMAA